MLPLPITGKRIVFGCDNIGDKAHFVTSGDVTSVKLVSIVVARKLNEDFSEESSDCWVDVWDGVELFCVSSMLLLQLESIFMGVAGGVCKSTDVGESTCSDEVEDDDDASDVDDFDEESILSVLLRLPPMPDSGVGRSRCLSS